MEIKDSNLWGRERADVNIWWTIYVQSLRANLRCTTSYNDQTKKPYSPAKPAKIGRQAGG
jgi:hypothetical protein